MSPRPGTGPRRPDALPAAQPDARAPETDAGPGLTGPARDDAPADSSRGPGRTPPDVDVTPATGPGPEDGYVTFGPDSATLGRAERAKLTSLFSTRAPSARRPVTVTVRGYASAEGDETYNRNLSAHRAVAVQRALIGVLPPGSEIRLLAHGETSAFGESAEVNRRVGVAVEPRTRAPFAANGAEPATGVEVADDGAGNPVAADPDAIPAPKAADAPVLPPLTPGLLEPDPHDLTGAAGTARWQRPRDPALSLFDHEDVYRPLYERGLRLDERLAGSVEAHYTFWFWRLHRDLRLPPTVAASIANAGAGALLNTYAAREQPTIADQFARQRDIEHQLQGGWQTPIVPLLTIPVDLNDVFSGRRR